MHTAQLPDDESFDPTDFQLLQQGVQQLRKFCFIQPSDKAKNQPVFMCAVYATSLVRAQLQASGSYTEVPEVHVQELVSSFHAFMPSIQFPDAVRWASLFQLYKPHKSNFRFITGCASIFITDAANLVRGLVEKLYDAQCSYARDLAKYLADNFGLRVRLDNVVSDYLTAALNFPKHVAVPELCTADIEKCYDVLPITADAMHGVPARLKFIIEVALKSIMENPCFYVRRLPRMRWSILLTSAPVKGYSALPVEKLPALVELLLQNCYIQGLGKLWKVRMGCPQGLPPCPVIVNNHLLSYDIEFILTRMFSADGRHAIVQLYTHQMKLIDDISVCGGYDVPVSTT
jgi:hypothetical protein